MIINNSILPQPLDRGIKSAPTGVASLVGDFIPRLPPCITTMRQILKPYLLLKNLITAGLFFFTLPLNASTDKPAAIVVTIKPLYSLVAHLTEGISEPVLLMKQAQSPHHYNMRPSERRLLENASMIVWLGPQLESYLSKVIEQQQVKSRQTNIVSAIEANNLNLLNKRNKHSHNKEHQVPVSAGKETQMIDPHIWLSTHNAIAISRYIAKSLISHDPKNTEHYNNNLQLLLNKIKQTQTFIKTSLTASPSLNKQPFISYHDAFQYFENENKLNYIDSINFDDETGTSLKHLRRIKAQIDNENIHCIVYQPPKPAIINSLIKQASIKATALDPLGLNVSNNKEAWFEIMRQLAVNFKQCLKSDSL